MAYFADRFHDALQNGGRALIVGVFPKDMPAPYREHPRLIYWDTDSKELKTQRIDELPVRTKVVVATRWISHAVSERIQMLARRSNIVYMGKLASTGEMAKMLTESLPLPSASPVADTIDIHAAAAAIPVDPTPPPVEEPVPELFPTPDPGTTFQSVSAAVRFYAQREIERLKIPGRRFRIAPSYFEGLATRVRAHGFETDATRVEATFFSLRSVYRARAERAALIEAAANATRPVEPEAVTAAPAPPVAPPEPLPADLDRIVAMADELEIKAITAVEIADQLRRIVREHRELRETKEKYDAMMAVMHGGAQKLNGHASHS